MYLQDKWRNAHSPWMWQSLHHEENPMHTPVKVVFPAAPNTRCWVNSLTSLYWVRPSLLSSSLFSVLFWARHVAILFSTSILRLCSEVVSAQLKDDKPTVVKLTCWGLAIDSHFSSASCSRSHNTSHSISRGMHWITPAQREGTMKRGTVLLPKVWSLYFGRVWDGHNITHWRTTAKCDTWNPLTNNFTLWPHFTWQWIITRPLTVRIYDVLGDHA